MNKWCIVSVLVGEKYKKFGKLFCKKYIQSTTEHNRADVVFVVDKKNDTDFADYSFVHIVELPTSAMTGIDPTRTYGTGTVRNFDYSLKRFGFKAGLDLGYSDICFIDCDILVREWAIDVFEECKEPGLWAGRGYPSSGFGTKPVLDPADVKFTPKLSALKKELVYDTDWVNYTMPFEAVMFMSGMDADSILKFVDCWQYVSEATKKLHLPMNKVCHEIGLAADMCSIPIRYNKKLLSIVFKHYIMNHDVLLNICNEEL
jgi:hypothetical protein